MILTYQRLSSSLFFVRKSGVASLVVSSSLYSDIHRLTFNLSLQMIKLSRPTLEALSLAQKADSLITPDTLGIADQAEADSADGQTTLT
jgi:hypothetical protein